MKNYCYKLLFACFLTATSFSQQVNNTEFKTKTLQVYQNLDKTRVPHGILLDFGMEFTNLKAFNGTLTDSTFTTSQTMSDIYKTLLMCRVRSNVTTGFITPQEYATRWYTQRTNGVMILSGNYFKYNNFADNAYPSKLNYSNNQFSDKFVGSTWQNPYQEKQLFAMAPAIASYKGLKLKVKLPANLFLSNYPTTIQNIQIDFSDGLGYRIVGYDQLVNVNYTLPNTYVWKYKITLTNGQTLLSHSKIEVAVGLKTKEFIEPCIRCPIVLETQAGATNFDPALAGFVKRTIVSTTQYLGYNASATIYIRYATGGNTIRKPLIVAEGFDEGIILKPEQEAGSNNINDLFNDVRLSNSNLLAEMNTYDIIYVDWNNGVTFLQRNAYVLQEVIKWVNNNKTTTTQNVVLGQSMGGLIARYALKDMENRGLPHDTRLYVSHDAPHLGANTPLSVQYSARHLRNLYINTPIALAAGEILIPIIYNFAEGFSSIINLGGGNTSVQPNITPLQAFSLADTPATRQMTYNWVNQASAINNTIHDAWQKDLASKGYPKGTIAKPVRNIAIANGSECGTTQPYNVNIMSYIKDRAGATDLPNYFSYVDAVYGTLLLNPAIIVTALLPGSSYWNLNFQAKYMTTLNDNKYIYQGYIGYKKKILWFIPVSIAITDVNISQPSEVLPFDIYGGGQQRTASDELPINGIVSNTFGFIPTASALDIGNGTTVINDIDYRKSYIGALPPLFPKNSPFQNFVTAFVPNNPNASNSGHISFNTRNGDWLQRELNPTAELPIQLTDCSFICDNNQINGSEIICESATYSINSGNTTYNWRITEGANLVTVTGNGTSSITLTANPNSSGQVTISLTMGNFFDACGTVVKTKTIHVGTPQLSEWFFYETQNASQCIAAVDFLITSLPSQRVKAVFSGLTTADITDVSNWEWVQENNLIIMIGNRDTKTICPMHEGFSSFKVRARNACGWSEWFELPQFEISLPASNPMRQNSTTYTIYPNPSNEIVNIDLRDQNKTPASTAIVSGELFDIMGQSKALININNNKATLDVKNLSKGIYVLKIYINDTVENHQIAVK